MSRQEVLESWGRLKVDLDTIKARNENCLIIEDCNREIGAGKLGIPVNHPRVSFRGTLVRELLEEQEYTLVNVLDLNQGGPWTWESAADSRIRSCLDLVIVSAGLLTRVSSLVVDSERKIPTDHYTLKIVFKNLPTRRESGLTGKAAGTYRKKEALTLRKVREALK